mmetsp:Transcript_27255/g.31106  ORF Transcript_27255/g.31106 Transcript_27255/m.31106 type:complete len:170 (-) Transcript_27255:130-639(-)
MGFAFAPISLLKTNVASTSCESAISAVPKIMEASSVLISDENPTAATTFEPILPDTTTLIGFGLLTVLCIIAWNVWSNQVVPVSRAKLAISKSKGEVKEYLDELKEEGDSRGIESWLFTDWLQDNKSEKQPAIPFLKKAKWNSGDNPVVVTAGIMMLGIIIASATERVL